MYQAAYGQKGTLVPGQSIAVNKYTVQVDRYLSQGGFAHVYLVRTATPVYGTTHHVLKRIAVASEAMLTEVKKEVDIMRLLQGHPNIVHLIDAAWHRMANGQYEVFILMEFCPGGGIIDMMNRRLHERLTEAEILQIFVDVCEGVACMHNLRPPLLHRDLKVENILQSSPTSFKLCDFGSATTVATRPPATTQEIRALEADLNRHTTLQYRAPEMVDPYLRRPVDEKSDVWALGVLLYKLCYYTTPFEEHGPLAILNVQYRTPAFPVYSPQMNALIASMLREHGTQRPTVFELLNHVHQLRGTKSKFHYNIPPPAPLSPRQMVPPVNPLESTISYRSAQQLAPAVTRPDINGSPSAVAKTQGVQAREKVLEAIAPMRRGRPTPSKEGHSDGQSTSRPVTPQRPGEFGLDKTKNWLDGGFGQEGDKSWNSSGKRASPSKAQVSDDAWVILGDGGQSTTERKDFSAGFGDSFSEKVWVLQDPNTARPSKSPQRASASDATKGPSAISPSTLSSLRLPAFTGTDAGRSRDPTPAARGTTTRDAFEGLGFNSRDSRAAPTLGEARKLRTGLASFNAGGSQLGGPSQLDSNKGPSLPRTSHLTQPPRSHSPTPSTGPLYRASQQTTSRPSSDVQPDGLPAESRFPSLAELDATFASTSLSSSSVRGDYDLYPSVIGQGFKRSPNLPAPLASESMLKPSSQISRPTDGTRSEQVTGFAMRDAKFESTNPQSYTNPSAPFTPPSGSQSRFLDTSPQSKAFNQTSGLVSRPSLIRKPPNSIQAKTSPQPTPGDSVGSSSRVPEYRSEKFTSLDVGLGRNSPRPSSSSNLNRDWLTGDVEIPSSTLGIPSSLTTTSVPVVRDAPSKRTSVIERAVPRQSIAPEQGRINTRRSPSPQPPLPEKDELSPTVSRFARAFPPVDLGDTGSSSLNPPASTTHHGRHSPKWSPKAAETRFPDFSENSSGDEGPEEAHGRSASIARSGSVADRRRKGRQSSVHELVDLWSGSQKEPIRPPIASSTSFTSEPQSSRTMQREPSDWLSTPASTASKKDAPQRSPSDNLPSPAFESDFSANRSGLGISNEQRRQGSSPGPSPRSSRPQSMFIFPSKSSEAANIPSPNLAPPEEPRPRRNLRRTSISDMVQHFEAIERRTKSIVSPTAVVPPSPVTARMPAFKPSTSMDGGRFGRSPTAATFAEHDKQERQERQDSLKFPSDSLSLPNNASSTSVSDMGGDPTKRRTSPRTSPIAPRTSPPLSRADLLPPSRDANENVVPRARTSSFKPDPVKVNFPIRRGAADEKSASSPRTGEARSPSPERPYQGVGKLIDQWQRKTAEAEAQSVTSKRSPFAAKRTGVVQGRGQ